MFAIGTWAGKREVGLTWEFASSSSRKQAVFLSCAVPTCSSDLFQDFPCVYERWFFLANHNFFRKQKCSLLVAWVSVIPCLFVQAPCARGQSQSQPGVRVQPSPDGFGAGFARSSMAPALDLSGRWCICSMAVWPGFPVCPTLGALFSGPFICFLGPLFQSTHEIGTHLT